MRFLYVRRTYSDVKSILPGGLDKKGEELQKNANKFLKHLLKYTAKQDLYNEIVENPSTFFNNEALPATMVDAVTIACKHDESRRGELEDLVKDGSESSYVCMNELSPDVISMMIREHIFGRYKIMQDGSSKLLSGGRCLLPNTVVIHPNLTCSRPRRYPPPVTGSYLLVYLNDA